MKKLLKYTFTLLLLLFFIAFLTGCNDKNKDKLAEWTIMIYMSGGDLESGDEKTNWPGGAMTADIAEILSVSGQPDNINIIIETGGAESWKNYDISSNELSRYHVKNQKLVLDETLPYESMGKDSTYQSFLEWGLTEYPAKHVGVILSGHGSYVNGYCEDSLMEFDSLENRELQLATKNAFNNTNIDKLDFIAYSTCYGQFQDGAYYNSQFYKYMLASQNLMTDEGFQYDTWLDDLYQYKDTLTVLKAIVDGFFDNINPLYLEHNMENHETLSILDLSYMESYKEAFEDMALDMIDNIQSYDIYKINDFAEWMANEVEHYEHFSYYTVSNFDVYDFLNKVENSPYNPGINHLNKIKTILGKMIVYSNKGPEAGNMSGLSFYFCYDYISKLDTVKKNTAFTNWMDFLQLYVDKLFG